jgi:SAM-dependent methyltransferase
MPLAPPTVDVPCALCGGWETGLVRRAAPYAIVRCRGCGLVYLSPRPTPEATAAIYGPTYFESRSGALPGYASYARARRSLESEAAAKLAMVERQIAPPARLLDHGCGTGVFLEAAVRRGYDAVGLDVSRYAIETLVRERGLPAKQGTLESGWGDDASFDVVTSWDVLEHVPNPNETLAAIARVLRPGGVLLATTPDVSGLDARLLGRRWYGFTKVPEHYYYYSRRTFGVLLRAAGLEPVRARRWGFVRDLGFCAEKAVAVGRLGALGGAARRFADTPLGRIRISFPFVDMLVVARRPYSAESGSGVENSCVGLSRGATAG